MRHILVLCFVSFETMQLLILQSQQQRYLKPSADMRTKSGMKLIMYLDLVSQIIKKTASPITDIRIKNIGLTLFSVNPPINEHIIKIPSTARFGILTGIFFKIINNTQNKPTAANASSSPFFFSQYLSPHYISYLYNMWKLKERIYSQKLRRKYMLLSFMIHFKPFHKIFLLKFTKYRPHYSMRSIKASVICFRPHHER